MAPFRRFSGDAVGLGAAGIVIGTACAGLGAPLLLVISIAVVSLLPRVALRSIFAASLIACFLLASLRGIGERATTFDPLAGLRDRILSPLVAALPGENGALAAGLTLGEDRYFSPEFKASMRASATTHLVALSGFNVMLMLGFARHLLRRRVSRKHEAYAGIALLGGFVLLAGAQPSLLRAAVMGTALLLGELAGRRVAPARLLLLTAAAMLLVDPQWATSLGFLLSFISSWALLAIFGDVERLLAHGIGMHAALRRLLLPSVVAQLGVAPALLASVGSVALVGLVVNPLVIPLTPLLTALGGGELLLAHVAPGMASLMAPACALLLAPATLLIRLAAHLPLQVSFMLPAWCAVLAYAASVLWTLIRKPELW